jgi:hypothetical protein
MSAEGRSRVELAQGYLTEVDRLKAELELVQIELSRAQGELATLRQQLEAEVRLRQMDFDRGGEGDT